MSKPQHHEVCVADVLEVQNIAAEGRPARHTGGGGGASMSSVATPCPILYHICMQEHTR